MIKLEYLVISFYCSQKQKKLVEEEEQKKQLEKRAQYIEATRSLLKFSYAAETAKVKSAKKVGKVFFGLSYL